MLVCAYSSYHRTWKRDSGAAHTKLLSGLAYDERDLLELLHRLL